METLPVDGQHGLLVLVTLMEVVETEDNIKQVSNLLCVNTHLTKTSAI